MKTYISYLKKTFILLIVSLFIISCEKEPDSIGLDLQPAGDKLNVIFTDTSSIFAYSVYDDSLRTDGYNYNLLGSIVDPTFGVTTASIFTQFRLLNNNVSFGTAPVLDSLILTIPYTGIYQYNSFWQKTASQHIKVFEVTDAMSRDSAYYSNKFLQYNQSSVLADMTFVPNATDSVTVAGVKYPALLRIKFNSTLGNKLLGAAATDLTDNDKFNQFIKGLFIKAEPLSSSMFNRGSIMYFSLLSSLSNLTLYYKSTSTDTVQSQYIFAINSYAARYNTFDHNGYANASLSFKNQLGVGMPKDTMLGKQTIYLQSMGGIKVNMKLPYIRNFVKDKKIAINEAVLVFKNADINDNFTPPASITMLKKLANGATAILPDLIEGSTFFDGYYNPYTREYRIRVTRYVQQLLTSYANDQYFVDYGLYVLVDNRRTTANRVMLKGTNSGGIKLELKYNVIK